MPTTEANTLKSLIEVLTQIQTEMLDQDRTASAFVEQLSPDFRASARNLLHYVALRRYDLRLLQEQLIGMGLSSLGRAESAVLANLQAVLRLLHRLAESIPAPTEPPAITHAEGRKLLRNHTHELLGPAPLGRQVRIMVTVPGEAADHGQLIRHLLHDGMDCMRINCAHDDAAAWAKMIAHLRQAEKELGGSCRVLMDLSGPKLRTGPMPPGPRVVKCRPKRDELGRVIQPAVLWLSSVENFISPTVPVDAELPVNGAWLSKIRVDDRIKFQDARSARREFVVSATVEGGCLATMEKTAYIQSGTMLHLSKKSRRHGEEMKESVPVGDLPEKPVRIPLTVGDTLILTRDLSPGALPQEDPATGKTFPPRIGCTLPQIFEGVKAGQPIWFDDGHLGGIIREIHQDQLHVEITQTAPGGGWLGSDKGINLPETALSLSALTEKDIADLRFVAANADMVGYSFVRSADDMKQLHAQLQQCGGDHLGIVLKIETRQAFQNLPELLLAAMKGRCVGVMIARGDLAVECGYERLAEVQEEILWICEAAHLPVIWATQVLENLAKSGMPSRAEVTDAAMGERAECVMLNKGPHIREAIQMLDGILQRMQGHQNKKSAMLRPLKVAHRFGTEPLRGNRDEKPRMHSSS